MSVVRYSEHSDVYMWPTGGCMFTCACDKQCNGTDEAIKHLEHHRKIGDKVPQYAFDDLKARNPETGSHY